MKETLKSKKGITLIALVITIIVLIILAGISISMLVGTDGIITKAKEGRQNMQNAAIEEQERLNTLYADFESGVVGTGGYDAIAQLINFKRIIAGAITDAGVATSEDDDAETMSDNIAEIYNAGVAAGTEQGVQIPEITCYREVTLSKSTSKTFDIETNENETIIVRRGMYGSDTVLNSGGTVLKTAQYMTIIKPTSNIVNVTAKTGSTAASTVDVFKIKKAFNSVTVYNSNPTVLENIPENSLVVMDCNSSEVIKTSIINNFNVFMSDNIANRTLFAMPTNNTNKLQINGGTYCCYYVLQ